MRESPTAISLLSGGLDSTLATILMVRQGIRTIAVKFMTPFGCDVGEGSSCGFDVSSLAKRFGFELKLCPMGMPYVQMVKSPAHGRGKNMNPCIDCRIMMLRWAGEFADDENTFLVTGEVVGQRPMSQNRQALEQIDRETGLSGRIVRPLSAKLLAPTLPEERGWIDREQLEAIEGRSRRRQIELAAQFGILPDEYGQPAGGCLLTDPGFSRRLEDLWKHEPEAGIEDITLLKLGRHFRGPGFKIVVGRNQTENGMIESLARPGDYLLRPTDVPGPTVLLRGSGEKGLTAAGALVRRYSDGKRAGPVEYRAVGNGQEWRVAEMDPGAATESLTHIV